MSSLRSIELGLIDEVFRGGEKGYVLDFSNRTFSEFFVRELDIDIDAPQYAVHSPTGERRILAQIRPDRREWLQQDVCYCRRFKIGGDLVFRIGYHLLERGSGGDFRQARRPPIAKPALR